MAIVSFRWEATICNYVDERGDVYVKTNATVAITEGQLEMSIIHV